MVTKGECKGPEVFIELCFVLFLKERVLGC